MVQEPSSDDSLARLRSALAHRYAVETQIGRGGMATVYRARDLKLKRPVAIKVLHPDLAATLGTERFLREVEIAAKLHHPHILALHDSGEADGLLYYVMPLAEGESLRARLNRGKQLPLEDALQIAHEVADALSYAHEHGVIHRDVKPENIMLESGHAVVTDFGIARAISEAGGERLTETGMALGSPAYMSPEQAAGSGDLDQRSDVYSLACVVYEMLAGEPPFSGPTAEVVIRKQITAEPPSLATNRPDLPPNFAIVLHRGLAKSVADRYACALPLTAALSELGAARTPRWRLAALAAPIVALLVVGGWLLWPVLGVGPADATEPPRIVVMPFENLGSPDDASFADGMTAEITNRLSSLSRLRVVSRQSALHMDGMSTGEIAEVLEVDFVLNGTVRSYGSADEAATIRISAELVRTADDANVWSDASTVTLAADDFFELQERFADRVAQALDVTILERERESFSKQPTNNRFITLDVIIVSRYAQG